jgi:hypothetical protein
MEFLKMTNITKDKTITSVLKIKRQFKDRKVCPALYVKRFTNIAKHYFSEGK